MARREERAYREHVSDEQRSQPGCPARELCDESLLRDTSISPHGSYRGFSRIGGRYDPARRQAAMRCYVRLCIAGWCHGARTARIGRSRWPGMWLVERRALGSDDLRVAV